MDPTIEAVMHRFVMEKSMCWCALHHRSGLDIPMPTPLSLIAPIASAWPICINCAAGSGVPSTKRRLPLLPRELMMVGAARKRINAHQTIRSLAPVSVAMRDLEIRGAAVFSAPLKVATSWQWFRSILSIAQASRRPIKGQKPRWRLE